MATIFETVESRGNPPYKVGTGLEPTASQTGSEQFFPRPTFAGALATLFDHSNAGCFNHGQRILDAEGHEVFSLENPNDLALLRSLDQTAGNWPT